MLSPHGSSQKHQLSASYRLTEGWLVRIDPSIKHSTQVLCSGSGSGCLFCECLICHASAFFSPSLLTWRSHALLCLCYTSLRPMQVLQGRRVVVIGHIFTCLGCPRSYPSVLCSPLLAVLPYFLFCLFVLPGAVSSSSVWLCRLVSNSAMCVKWTVQARWLLKLHSRREEA